MSIIHLSHHICISKFEALDLFQFHSCRTSVPHLLVFVQIRPVDRKMQYQIQKLTNTTATTTEEPGLTEKGADKREKDLIKYRPNPDLLLPKIKPSPEVINTIIQQLLVIMLLLFLGYPFSNHFLFWCKE